VTGFGVKVVLIEPGIIRTGYAEAAVDSMGEPETGGPYAAFDAAVARATRETYERGPLARLGGGPETVAGVIERAISTEKPRARYAVTPSATLLMTLRRIMPDRAWDAFLRSSFPRPGRTNGGSAS